MPNLLLLLVCVVVGAAAAMFNASLKDAAAVCFLITIVNTIRRNAQSEGDPEDDGCWAAAASGFSGQVRLRMELWFNLVSFAMAYGLVFLAKGDVPRL